jgi:hypothetical protein
MGQSLGKRLPLLVKTQSRALGEKVAEDFLLARDVVITISSITDHVRVSPIIS